MRLTVPDRVDHESGDAHVTTGGVVSPGVTTVIGDPTSLTSSIQTKSLLSPRSSRIRREKPGASAASAGSEMKWLASVSGVVNMGVGITQMPLLVAISVSSAA